MIRIITLDDGRRYLCEGISHEAMIEEIIMAIVSGSVGHSSVTRDWLGEGNGFGPERLIAKAHQINSDYSERQPGKEPF